MVEWDSYFFFFHYARYTENTLFEDFGGEILDEIFDDMHTEMIWGFESSIQEIELPAMV